MVTEMDWSGFDLELVAVSEVHQWFGVHCHIIGHP